MDEGHFRQDLFYRLNVFPIFIPALKERKDDIPRLAYYFLKLFCRKTGKRVEGFTDEALETLIRYDWPGNVRELKNVVERLVILAEGKTLENIYPLYPTRLRGGSKADRVPETAGELRDFKRAPPGGDLRDGGEDLPSQGLGGTAGEISPKPPKWSVCKGPTSIHS